MMKQKKPKKIRKIRIKGRPEKKYNWDTMDVAYDRWVSGHLLYGPSYRRDKEVEDLIMNPDKYRK